LLLHIDTRDAERLVRLLGCSSMAVPLNIMFYSEIYALKCCWCCCCCAQLREYGRSGCQARVLALDITSHTNPSHSLGRLRVKVRVIQLSADFGPCQQPAIVHFALLCNSYPTIPHKAFPQLN
jgi:hypothetical protein